MASKGTKRSAEGEHAQAPLTKHAKDILKKQEVAQYKFQAIAGSILTAGAHMGEDCRNMLVAMLPYSLCTPSDERDEHQNTSTSMVGDVFQKLTADHAASVTAAHKTVEHLTNSRDSLDGELSKSESARKACEETLSVKKTAYKDRQADEKRMQEAFDNTKNEEDAAALAFSKLQEDQAQIRAAISDHLRALRDDVLGVKEAKQHQSILLPLLRSMKADESLIVTLPGMCQKKPEERGAFDNMVMQQLEQILKTKADQIEADLVAGASAAAARAAATASAQSALDDAASARAQASQKTQEAQTALQDAAKIETAAADAVANYEPMLREASELRDSKELEFKQFNEQHLAVFEQLRDRISKKLLKEQKEEAAAKAAEEAAAREAAEAAAKAKEDEDAAAKYFAAKEAAAKVAAEAAVVAARAESPRKPAAAPPSQSPTRVAPPAPAESPRTATTPVPAESPRRIAATADGLGQSPRGAPVQSPRGAPVQSPRSTGNPQ